MSDRQKHAPVMLPTPDRRQCERALDELVALNVDGISLALLAYRDGHPYLFRGKDLQNAGKLAAMASSMAALSGTMLREIDSDSGEMTLLQGKKGKIIIVQVPAANNLMLLAVHTTEEVNLGLLLAHTKSCVTRVAASFGSTQDGQP